MSPPLVAPVVADIQVMLPTRTQWMDVAIVSPTGPSYVAIGSATVDLAAASKKQHDKTSKYAAVIAAMHMQSSALVPFVVEATGRLGPSASAFLDLLKSQKPSIVDFFLRRLHIVLAHYNALLAHRCAMQRHALPG